MKQLYTALGLTGAIIILGTAGGSDILGIDFKVALAKCMLGLTLVLIGRYGFVAQSRKKERICQKPILSDPAISASKVA